MYYIYGKISKIIYYVTPDEKKATAQYKQYIKHYRDDDIIIMED